MWCGEWRTNFKKILINVFISSPIPDVSNETGVNYPDEKVNNGSYGGLLPRLALLSVSPMPTMTMPFDYLLSVSYG